MGDLCLVHAPWRELNAVDAEKLKKVPDGLTPSVPRPKPGKWGRNGRVETLTNVVGLLVCWFGLDSFGSGWNIMNSVFGLSIASCWSFFSRCSIDVVISRNHGAHRNLLFNLLFYTILYEMAHTPQKFVQHPRSKSLRTFSPLGTSPGCTMATVRHSPLFASPINIVRKVLRYWEAS